MSKALSPDKSLLKPHSRASNPVSAWSPPPSGSIKINRDVSWNAGSHSSFAGIVVCNHTGVLLEGRRVSISGPSALSCEALALRKACLMGKALHLSGIQVENDNKHLITLCVFELVPPWECRVIIQDIKTLATGLHLFILWVPREANCAAHWMASPF